MKTIIKIEPEWNNAHCSIADAEEVLPGWAELPEATFATELALEADDRDGLDGQLGDGTKVEQATDAGVDDAEHDDGAPINTGGDAGGQE